MSEAETLLGGRFRLGELLGVGGSASVFAAEDLEHDTEVAVKVLHPHLSAERASRGAFLEEAAAVAHVQHANIATVYASGLHDAGGMTMAWIALELVSGGSVADRIAHVGPMGPGEAAAVLDGVLGALAAAHAVGLVHRDVSPANVLLEPLPAGTAVRAEQVRLVDFGLADLTGRPSLGSDVLRSGTGEAGVVGNALYMSPEQALGRPVRAAGDLYQAGALLHFLLTGRPPFERDSTTHVLEAHVSAPPPVPSALVPGARPLDRLVTRAMTKTPARRFRNAEDFREALAAAVDGLEPLPPAEPAFAAEGTGSVRETAATMVLPTGGPGRLAYLDVLHDTGGDLVHSAGSAPPPSGSSTLDVSDADWSGSASSRSGSSGGGVALLVGVVLLSLATWGVVAANTPVAAGPTPSASTGQSPVASSAAPTGDATPAPSAPASPTAPPSAVAPEQVSVPTIFGSVVDAEAALSAAGLVIGEVERVASPESADRVLAQSPRPGASVAPGSSVDLTVADGTNSVPSVAGMTVAGATAIIESAGFLVEVDGGVPSALTVVVGTEPGAGAVLRVGVTVVLVVSSPAPEPTETTPPGSAPEEG